jgi:ABC-type transport system involved in multi-copper enzyme maturation permease subunit
MSNLLLAAPEATKPAGSSPRLGSPAVLHALYWLIHDTFRQALASRIFWIMLGVSILCTVFCFGISVETALAPRLEDDTALFTKDLEPFTGTNHKGGSISLLFGFMKIEHSRDVESAVRFIQGILASFVAGFLGFALVLIWTAGFVPEFLQPGAVSVLLAKPVPRGTLLTGKYLGVLAFVGFQVLIFFAGTWLALALRTGIWDAGYLAAVPLFLLQFAMIYSFGLLIAVLTRSTVACIFGTILFWLLCWGINVGRHFAVGFEQLAGGTAHLGAVSRSLIELSYWVLPKPADIFMLMEESLHAGNYAVTLSAQQEMQAVLRSGQFIPELSVLSSLAFAACLLYLSARQLAQTDY